jgi:putative PEP-CTERM system TPR-repeat lipoprotein
MLAVSLMRGGQIQRAIELLEQSLTMAPDDAQLLALAGEAHLNNMDLHRAIPYLERAAKTDPKSSRAQASLQTARLMGGDSARALSDLEANMKVDTGSSERIELLYVATLVHRRQFEQATKAIVNLEKNQPNNPLTHNLKAAILLGKGDTDNARKSLERALTLNPKFAPAAVNLAKLDLRERNPRGARRRLEAILERDPANPGVLDAFASLGPEFGVTNELLIEWLERGRRASPNAMRVLVLLANAHLRAANPQKALEFSLAAQSLNPDNPDVLDALASAQLALGRHSDALGTYSKLAVQSPKSPPVLFRLASAQAATGSTAAATITLRKLLGIDPNFLPAHILLAEIELAAGRTDAAIQIAQDLQKQYPKLPLSFVLEADAHSKATRHGQALRLYDSASQLGDRSGRLAIKTHSTLVQLGRAADADAYLTRYTRENPEEIVVLAYIADVHLFARRYANAVEYYQRVLEKQPNNALILNNLAWASFKLQDRRARQYAEKAHSLAPDNAVVLDTYAWILADNGDLARAGTLLERAITQAPDSRNIRFNLATVLYKSGQLVRARRELESALNASGPFDHQAEAQELLKRMR